MAFFGKCVDDYDWDEVGAACGLSVPTLRRVCRGDLDEAGYPKMTMRTFLQLAEGLGFDVQVVLESV